MLHRPLGKLGAGQEDAITAQRFERDEAPEVLCGLTVEGGEDRVADVGRAPVACSVDDEGAKLLDIGPIAA
jgi:hypothetical protein